jgi:lipopolysaccharide export system permease protein
VLKRRGSNTPITTQALRCFSGLPLFMLNSTGTSLLFARSFDLQRRMRNYQRSAKRKSKSGAARIFVRSALRELTLYGIAVFVGLLAITLVTSVIKLLDLAATGVLPPSGVAALLGFRTLSALPPLLGAAGFVAVLLTVSRSYRDSEMVVWFSSGVSLLAWLRPVLLFMGPLSAVIAVLSLGLAPWANAKGDELREILRSRPDTSLVRPGTFQETKQADRVFFVEDLDVERERVSNVFVQSIDKGEVSVMVARSGYLEVAPNGDRFLVMEKGTRHQGPFGSPEFKIMSFDRYAIRIDQKPPSDVPLWGKSAPTAALLADPTPPNLAELGWRIGQPVSAILLALIAITLAQVNPRAGRSLNMALAVLVYLVYNNLQNVLQVWMQLGKLSPAIGIWVVHAAMAAAIAFLFFRRLSVFRLARGG